MLRDILGQAWEAMLFNRRRTAITTIGMAWGIATVVLLLAYGNGFSHAIETIFAEWGTNTIGFFPGKTSQQAGGDKAGVQVRLTLDDVDRVTAALPEIVHISPMQFQDEPVENDLHTYTWTIIGSRPSYADIIKLTPDSGPLLQRRRRRPARARLRPRLRCQNQALLRRLGRGSIRSHQGRRFHRRRRPPAQNAGVERQHQ